MPGRKILIILFVAAAARLCLPLTAFLVTRDATVFHTPDTSSYLIPARSLVEGLGFSWDNLPEIVRTPAYSLLLIPGVVLSEVEWITIGLQILLSCLTVYLVYRISFLVFKEERIATLSAALYAAEPMSVLYCSLLMTETLFAPAILLSLYCLLLYDAHESWFHVVCAALALALAAYVRPVAYYLPIVTFLVLIIRTIFGGRRIGRLIAHAALFLVVSMSLVACWQVRNYQLTGYSGFAAIKEANLYFCQGASVLAVKQGISVTAQQAALGYGNKSAYLHQHPEQTNWSQSQVFPFMGQEGMRIILADPMIFAKTASR